MYFKVGKIFFVNNLKNSKMMLNIMLWKLPSPHGEFSVMLKSNLQFSASEGAKACLMHIVLSNFLFSHYKSTETISCHIYQSALIRPE